MEFRCGGETAVRRPPQPDRAAAEQWADYLFYRNNSRGAVRERWVHSFGCGRWFTVQRDTVTHEISDPQPMAGPESAAPRPGSGADST